MLAPTFRVVATIALGATLGSLGGCLPSRESTTTVQPGTSADSVGTGTVVSITDGDTLRLDVDGAELRVRLIGIDAPEVYPDIQCFGPEAEAALTALAAPGSTLTYAYDRDPRDRFDRELMYLFTADGTFINLLLVAEGYAEAVLFEPNDRYVNDLRAAEQTARDARLGLWGQC
jgi:micrococcal nuclease